jgi:hypothetical protein
VSNFIKLRKEIPSTPSAERSRSFTQDETSVPERSRRVDRFQRHQIKTLNVITLRAWNFEETNNQILHSRYISTLFSLSDLSFYSILFYTP